MACIDVLVRSYTAGAFKSGAVTKIKNTGLKGYREFEKLLASYMKQGNNWRKEAGKMYQSNKIQQQALRDYEKLVNYINYITTTQEHK